MESKLLIKERRAYGVGIAKKKGLMFVMAKTCVFMFDMNKRKYIGEFPMKNPTDIVFDEDNEYAFCLDAIGDLFLFTIDKLIAGEKKADIIMEAFEILNPCSSLTYLHDGILLGIGTSGDYLIDIFEEKKTLIYDISDDKGVGSNNRYYDAKNQQMIIILKGNDNNLQERKFIYDDFDISIPMKVITLKSDEYITTYVEGFRILTEKKLSGMLRKESKVLLKGEDYSIHGMLPDKKYRKLLEQDNIYQTAIVKDHVLLLNTYKSLIVIDILKDSLSFDLYEGVYGQFEILDDDTVYFTIENEGIMTLSI